MPDSDPDCVFCRIANGTVPAKLVFDTGTVVAFHDVNPLADVHVLVVPKSHHRDVVALAGHAPGELADVIAAAQRVADELAPDGHFRLMFNTGSQAGQSVFHVHGHVLAGGGPAMRIGTDG